MTEFVPYYANPFEGREVLRLIPESNDDASYYQLFVKNMMAAFYYLDFKLRIPTYYKSYPQNQQLFHKLYLLGKLEVDDGEGEFMFPAFPFQRWELERLKDLDLPEAVAYRNFLIRNTSNFTIVGKVLAYPKKKNDYFDFGTFLNEKLGIIPYLEITEISTTFESLEAMIVHEIQKQFLEYFHFDNFRYGLFDYHHNILKHHLNNDLIEPEMVEDIKTYSIKWLGQRLRAINFKMGLRAHETVFHKLKENFILAIDYAFPNTSTESIDYPRHIFTKPAAYLLFHELASQFTKKSPISFLYRQMAEKDNLIHARDTEFRNWFQSCGYPAELYSTTETYDRAQTEERKIFLELLYKKYQLP